MCSCSTGTKDVFAVQTLARLLGVNVMAPSDTLWFVLDDNMTIGEKNGDNNGTWIIFKRQVLSVIWIGEFKETHNNDKYPSIFTAIRDKAPENKQKILAYMKSASPVAIAPGYLHDRIDGTTLLKNPTCYSDGVFSWQSDLIYYYEKYNIELPNEFMQHVLKKQK